MSDPARRAGALRRRAGRATSARRRRRRRGGRVAVEELLVELGGRRPARGRAGGRGPGAASSDPAAGALLVAEAERRDRRRARRQLAAGDPRARPLRAIQDLWVDPAGAAAGSAPSWSTALAALAREQGVARLEVGLPRESFAAIARHRGLLPRQRVRAPRAADAAAAVVSELLMVEQRPRPRRRRALDPRRRPHGSPASDSNLRLAELRERPGPPRRRARGRRRRRRRGARARRSARCTSARYLDALRRGRRRTSRSCCAEFAPPGLEPDIPVSAGLVAAAREGGADGDHRGRAAGRRRPLHLRGLPPARPPRRPRLPRRLLLPQQRRRGGADALRRRRRAGRDPRPRPPLPERHRGAGRADGGRDPALAARLAGHQRRRRGRCCRRPRANGSSPSPPAPTRTTYLDEVAASIEALAARRGGAGRLARLRHRRRRPARRLGLRAGDLRRRSAACSPPPGCRSA